MHAMVSGAAVGRRLTPQVRDLPWRTSEACRSLDAVSALQPSMHPYPVASPERLVCDSRFRAIRKLRGRQHAHIHSRTHCNRLSPHRARTIVHPEWLLLCVHIAAQATSDVICHCKSNHPLSAHASFLVRCPSPSHVVVALVYRHCMRLPRMHGCPIDLRAAVANMGDPVLPPAGPRAHPGRVLRITYCVAGAGHCIFGVAQLPSDGAQPTVEVESTGRWVKCCMRSANARCSRNLLCPIQRPPRQLLGTP